MKPYTKQEQMRIAGLYGKGFTNQAIAGLLNQEFHNGRSVRTARAIEARLPRKVERRPRFLLSCEFCGKGYRHNWPQSRYCSSECRAGADREIAIVGYAKSPKTNVQMQTRNKRAQMQKRWAYILGKYGDRCSRCGYTYPIAVYDLHHPNGKVSRKETPSRILRGGSQAAFERMVEEVVILCANCHRLVHAEQGNWAPKQY